MKDDESKDDPLDNAVKSQEDKQDDSGERLEESQEDEDEQVETTDNGYEILDVDDEELVEVRNKADN